MRRMLAPRVEQEFLRNVIARAIAIPVLLLGVYEAREVIFPQGVLLVRLDRTPPKEVPAPSASTEASSAEGGLGNEISELPRDIVDATIPEAASGNLLSGR